MSSRRAALILVAALAALSAFRVYYIGELPLSEDEAYYWVWSRDLAWGYFDQGPMVAWLIRLGTMALGVNPAGVRLGAVAGGLALSLLIYRCAARLHRDPALGLVLALAMNATILFSAGAVIHTYDTPQAFFWLLCCYWAARAMAEDAPRAWYGAGAALGLALLSKYSSLLLPLMILGFLLADPERRFWLRRKEPWLGLLIALLVFSPNLAWNASHGWATVAFNAARVGQDWNFTTFEFLGGQAGLIGPLMFGLLAWGLLLAWRRARAGDFLQAFWLWTSLPVMALFVLLSAKTRVQPNWAAPAYLTAFIAAGSAIAPRARTSRRVRRWAAAALAVGWLTLVPVHLHAPLIKALGVDPDRDPTNKMYGWPALGPALAEQLAHWPGEEKPFIFSMRHQIASLAAFYTPGRPETHVLFLPDTKRCQYLFTTDPARLKSREGLAVVYGGGGLERLFERVEPLGRLELRNRYGRVYHRVKIFRCIGFLGKDFR